MVMHSLVLEEHIYDDICTIICSLTHRLNIELELQSLFGLHVQSCTHWHRAR